MKVAIRYMMLLCLTVFVGLSSYATHNRAGEITYKHVGGYTYEITITTCTKTSVIADRQWLPIDWGDVPEGQELDSLERVLPIQNFPSIDSQINTYIGLHTYPGPGIYVLTVEDPNRNINVHNIPVSVETSFCVRSELIINPQTGHNNSVQMLNPPKERACLNQLWIHNPAAYDPDGDYLTYELVSCLGLGCEPIPGYQFPADYTAADDTFEINSETGDLIWDVPTVAGEFNVAILITEWRMVDGNYIKVGSVIRDMQITIELCDNNPPQFVDIPDTCVVIDDVLSFDVFASDPDGGFVFLSAVGGPFQQSNFATFNAINGIFSWQPDCEEVRAEPYYVSFIANDQGNVPLTDIETVAIQVIAPAVQNPTAEPSGNTIVLNWDAQDCISHFPSSEYLGFSYKIYRKNQFYGFVPDYCETGVPEYTGYILIGTVGGLDNTTFVDDFDLGYGGLYCYMIVTCWPDGAESKASVEVCTELIKDSPIITHVSVVNTSETVGENYIAWSPPTELDTTNWTGPYQYKLRWINTGEVVYTSSLSPFLIWPDTIVDAHSGINTLDVQNKYGVEFYSNGELAGSSVPATSVFITLEPNDNQLTVSIDYQVPWQNYEFEVYVMDNVSGEYFLDGISASTEYVIDSLVNNVEYCVKVLAWGSYNVEGIVDPLENWSQVACAAPFDLTPPCPPQLVVFDDCIGIVDELEWTNPNHECADDVTEYNLYYAPFSGDGFELIESFSPDNDTTFEFVNDSFSTPSIAGCFYVTALDSLLMGPEGVLTQNESLPSDTVCVDNCPIYFLPNIFSPNYDQVNDFFVPFPYKFVESVDFHVFNRWGDEVFSSTDPDLNWDGTHMKTGEVLSDGVYYYTIQVNTIRLEGILPERFSGNIQLLDGKNPSRE